MRRADPGRGRRCPPRPRRLRGPAPPRRRPPRRRADRRRARRPRLLLRRGRRRRPLVGGAVEASPGSPLTPAAPDPENDRLAAAAGDAKARGDVVGLVQHGRAYLARLGFPGPVNGRAESHWAWGGARYSYVFRDLALGAELLGDPTLAGQLYRRADPGGGMCGTSVSYRWSEQVRGAIRSAERAGDCRVAVAERLLDVDGPRDMYPKPAPDSMDYGPARLAAAGFDVARLYRGALLTAGRDAEPAVLRAALERAPEPLRAVALSPGAPRPRGVGGPRPRHRGPRRRHRPRRPRRARAPPPRPRRRPSPARPRGDRRPRRPTLVGPLRSRRGRHLLRQHEQPVVAPRHQPRRQLRDRPAPPRGRPARPLAHRLARGREPRDPRGRRRRARPDRPPRRAPGPARPPERPLRPGGQHCDDAGCRPYFPVREAVREAIAAITERSAQDARWRRNDRKRPTP
ncbi:hypothetical protein [Nannocystis pusilla]|uniref:hypothetical protein n=1 Tax=Nannocystis pusilla TaxID=889268 RepID=UPI003B7FDBC0